MERRSGLYVSYLAFDTASEIARFCSASSNPFRQAAVRKAVDMAVDRRRLGAELPSGPRPATQFVPPSVFGFDPAIGRAVVHSVAHLNGVDIPLTCACRRDFVTQCAQSFDE